MVTRKLFFIALFFCALGLVSNALVQAVGVRVPREMALQAAPPQSENSDLTVEDVLHLVQAGLAEDLIITKVVQSGKVFSLSTDQLLQLKEAGASDNIIRAMMNPAAPVWQSSEQPAQTIPTGSRSGEVAEISMLTAPPGSASIPAVIQRTILDSDEFKKDIEIQMVLERGDRQEILQYQQEKAVHGRTRIGIGPREPSGLYYQEPSAKLSRLLESLGYIHIEPMQIGASRNTDGSYYETTRYAVFFDPKLNDYLRQDSGAFGYPINFLRIARRQIDKVTYTNRYKINPFGTGEREAFALTFSYFLQELIPDFPQVEREFIGKAQFELDPADGQWKVQGNGLGGVVRLADRGSLEYQQIIESMDFRIPDRSKTVQRSPDSPGSTQEMPFDPGGSDEEDVQRATETLADEYPDARGFQVRHDHGGGALLNDESRWRFCEGVLYVFGNHVIFETTATRDGERHDFEATFADIREVKGNFMPLIRYKAFHIRLESGQNYNFAFPGLDPNDVLAVFPETLR